MKYTIPETTFEDQIYSLFTCEKPPVVKETDLNNIYKTFDGNKNGDVTYCRKYEHYSLYNSDFAVDKKTFEEKIFQAFKSHTFCINKRNPVFVIEEVFNKVLGETLDYAYGNKELQEKRFEYFKSLVNVMNRIIEDEEIQYPSGLFKIAILNEINDNYLTNPASKLKESLLYFAKNIKTDKNDDNSIALGPFYTCDVTAPYAFIMYLIILTKFKDEQHQFKNLIWDEFNEINSIQNAHRLNRVMNMQNLKKIDFNVIDKDVLLDKIDLKFIMEMRSFFSGKSKIKDSLTQFLDPLTNEQQKREMFLKSVFNKNMENKYILIEKKYFPGLINTITEDDINNAFDLNANIYDRRIFFVNSLENLVEDENNFIVKMLGKDYDHKIPEDRKNGDLVVISKSVVEAFRVYNIKEEKKALKKAINNIKKSKIKQRI